MSYFLYNLLLRIFSPFLFLFFVYRTWKRKDSFIGLNERFGFNKFELENLDRKKLWFHAVSVGEVKVAETPVKVKPEVSLISRDQYLQDVKNRWQIHQFETQQLWEDLVKGYNYVSPYVTKSIDYVTSAYNKQFNTKTSS